ERYQVLRHRHRPRPAPLHRDAGQPPRRGRDPQVSGRRPPRHAEGGAEPVLGLPADRPRGRHLRGDHDVPQGLTPPREVPHDPLPDSPYEYPRMTASPPSAEGVPELHPRGYGSLRAAGRSYQSGQGDAYVAAPMIQKHRLREGLHLAGPVEPPKGGTGPRLSRIDAIEGKPADAYAPRTFEELTPVDPHQ